MIPSGLSPCRVVYGDRPMRETARRLAQSVDGNDLRRMFSPQAGQRMPGGFQGSSQTGRPMSLAEQVHFFVLSHCVGSFDKKTC